MRELSRFVRRHPNACVGRPPLAAVLGGTAAALGSGLAMAVLAVRQAPRDPAVAAVAVLMALSCAAVVAALWRKLVELLSLLWRGAASYAIAQDELILVDRDGTAVIVELSLVTALELRDGEPRLRIDSEHRGRVYRVMFAIFDADFDGPDAERFFERLAPRLRSSALIARHEVSEHGMPA